MLFIGLKTDEKDDPETPTNVDVEAVGVFTNGEWVTFHSTADNFINNVVAAFPTRRVIAVRLDES